jgi:hypothetical protein
MFGVYMTVLRKDDPASPTEGIVPVNLGKRTMAGSKSAGIFQSW